MKKWLVVSMLTVGMQAHAESPNFRQLEAKSIEAVKSERWSEAVASMEKMIATKEPLPKDFKFEYALALANTRDYERALDIVTEYLEEQGESAKYYRDASRLSRAMEKILMATKGDSWVRQHLIKEEEKRAKEQAANKLAAKQLEEIKEAEKLAARPNLRNMLVLGGGGALKGTKSTPFDATLAAASKIYQRDKWNTTVAFDGSHDDTSKLTESLFANATVKTSFSQNNYNVLVNGYGKASVIKAGDQFLVIVDGYGALKTADEISHSIAVYDAEAPFDLNMLKGASTLSLDKLKLWADSVKQKGAKLAIVDFTSHSGNTLALANANTCVVSGTGPLHFRSEVFVQELFNKIQPGKSLEGAFLEARRDTLDNAFPMISTSAGMAINQDLYPLLTPYLYRYDEDPLGDKMMAYLTESLSDEAYAKREQQYKNLLRRLDGLAAKSNAMGASIQSLKTAIRQYKEKQDAYINGARPLGAGNLSKREQFTGEAELGGKKGSETRSFSWAEILQQDTEQILRNLRSAREASRNAQFLAEIQAMVVLQTKVHDRKAEILAAYPYLKDYKSRLQKELDELKAAAGLAAEIGKQERSIYEALYKSTGRERDSVAGDACRNFVF